MTGMRNYTLHTHAGEVLAVRQNGDSGPELFVKAGETANARALSTGDAVIYDGQLLDVCVKDGLILLQDPWAGIRERLAPSEWVEPSVATFDRIEPVFSNGGGETDV